MYIYDARAENHLPQKKIIGSHTIFSKNWSLFIFALRCMASALAWRPIIKVHDDTLLTICSEKQRLHMQNGQSAS